MEWPDNFPERRTNATPLFSRSFLLLAFAFACGSPRRPAAAPPSPLQLADPLFGTDGGGNTVPGASVPFGFVSVSPDTTHGSTSGYDGHGLILGFSQTHVAGTGGGSKYGNFRVTPALGEDGFANLGFARSEEQARPGFYAVCSAGPGGRSAPS